jgi:hypothetical protein
VIAVIGRDAVRPPDEIFLNIKHHIGFVFVFDHNLRFYRTAAMPSHKNPRLDGFLANLSLLIDDI